MARQRRQCRCNERRSNPVVTTSYATQVSCSVALTGLYFINRWRQAEERATLMPGTPFPAKQRTLAKTLTKQGPQPQPGLRLRLCRQHSHVPNGYTSPLGATAGAAEGAHASQRPPVARWRASAASLSSSCTASHSASTVTCNQLRFGHDRTGIDCPQPSCC